MARSYVFCRLIQREIRNFMTFHGMKEISSILMNLSLLRNSVKNGLLGSYKVYNSIFLNFFSHYLLKMFTSNCDLREEDNLNWHLVAIMFRNAWSFDNWCFSPLVNYCKLSFLNCRWAVFLHYAGFCIRPETTILNPGVVVTPEIDRPYNLALILHSTPLLIILGTHILRFVAGFLLTL